MNILKLESFFDRTEAVYIVTERMQKDLLVYITESTHRYLDEDITRVILFQVLAALKYLHQKMYAHRDIKCENILLTCLPPINATDPSVGNLTDYPLIKLADFGFSRIIREHSFRKTRIGTVRHTLVTPSHPQIVV
jgi:protein kinase D